MDEVDVRTIQYAMEEAECAAIDAMNEELLLPLLLHQLLLKIISIVGSEVMVVMIAVILAVRGTQEPFFDIDLCSNRIIGVAKFEYMGPYLGVLSHMDRTLRCSSHYFGGDLAHNRHWRVVGGARLRVPAIIDAVGFGLQRPSNMMFAVTPDSRDQLLASPLYGSESLASDFLTNWGVPAPASVDTVLQLPYEIASLICVDLWKYLALDIRSRVAKSSSMFGSWTAMKRNPYLQDHLKPTRLEHRLEDALEVDSAPSTNIFEQSMFLQMANSLRTWAETIAQNSANVQGTQGQIALYVDWLDECVRALDKERSQAWLRTQTGRRGGDQTQHALAPFQQTVRGNTFAPLFLIHALIFSFHLRSTDKTANMKKWGHDTSALNVVMARALRCFPPEVASLAQLVVQKMVLPSAATMTRARFYLDVAWMLQMSQFHSRLISEGACLYGMLDSSPQGGRNWLMTEYSGIHGRSLIEAAGSAHSMALLASAGAEDEDGAEDLVEHA